MADAALSRADVQRARITYISADIFSRRGFRATSMNEIAAAAGLSKPTLYHYFRSKEELLVRIYSDVLDESLAMGERCVADAQTPLDAIRDLVASRVVYTCENKALLTVCFEEEHELPPDLAEVLLRRRRAFEHLFESALECHLREHPALRLPMTPKVYVNMCLGAVNWCYKWYRPTGPSTPAQLGQQLAHTLTASLKEAWMDESMNPPVLVIMGVSGCGKSTVAGVLAGRLGWDLAEGDDMHPLANVEKMAAGHPLEDSDRWPWLARVAGWINEHTAAGRPGIVTCSSLKHSYRDVLRGDHVVFVYLHGTREQIANRLAVRHSHFMPAALLDSQFAALEPPGPDERSITVDIGGAPDIEAAEVIRRLMLEPTHGRSR